MSEPLGADRLRMVEQHLPLADKLARRYGYTSEPIDDLTQVARLGLTKAVARWDPDRGTAFSSFAVPTILGELRRYFRDSTWTVRPPRDLQELFLKVKKVREALSQELGREPTVRDIAQRLGQTPEQIVEAVHAGELHSPVSLDVPLHDVENESLALVDRVADTRRELARVEDSVTLQQLSAVVKDRDWEVVRLRYQGGPPPARDRRARRLLADARVPPPERVAETSRGGCGVLTLLEPTCSFNLPARLLQHRPCRTGGGAFWRLVLCPGDAADARHMRTGRRGRKRAEAAADQRPDAEVVALGPYDPPA
jgi:RNA polymerase sigma-B factor